jgi:putative transposase
MTNHIHFLVTPRNADSISKTMREVGSRYALSINKKYQRTGTLWEGRHWSSLVEADSYLLECYRYIELNPVRAGICDSPGGYLWSSYRSNAFTGENWISPHALYTALGSCDKERNRKYREFLSGDQPEKECEFLTKCFLSNFPAGSVDYVEMLESCYNIRFHRPQKGRPPNPQPQS